MRQYLYVFAQGVHPGIQGARRDRLYSLRPWCRLETIHGVLRHERMSHQRRIVTDASTTPRHATPSPTHLVLHLRSIHSPLQLCSPRIFPDHAIIQLHVHLCLRVLFVQFEAPLKVPIGMIDALPIPQSVPLPHTLLGVRQLEEPRAAYMVMLRLDRRQYLRLFVGRQSVVRRQGCRQVAMRVVSEGTTVVVLRPWLVLRNDAHAAAQSFRSSTSRIGQASGQQRNKRIVGPTCSAPRTGRLASSPLCGIVDPLAFQAVTVPHVVLVLLVELIVRLVAEGPAPEDECFLNWQAQVLSQGWKGKRWSQAPSKHYTPV